MSAGIKRPRIYYGYTVVFACFVIMAMTFGLHYSFGIFFKPLLKEFGWSRAATSAAYSATTLISGFMGIMAGRLSDFFGPKIVGVLTGVFLGAGFLLLSQTRNLWHLYLFYGVVMAAGVGGCWPGLMPAVAKWFTARRGLMTGIVASGIGFGTIVIPPLAERLISIYDWRTAYIVIGVITLVTVIGIAQFLKAEPPGRIEKKHPEKGAKGEEADPGPDGLEFRTAIRNGQFWLLGFTYFCYGYTLHTIMVHIAPYVQDLGLSSAEAARIYTLIGATSILSRIITGGASDRFGIKPSLLTGLLFMIISMVWIQFAGSRWMFYLFGMLFGIAYGGVMSMQAVATAKLFGLQSLGVILGTITFMYTLGGSISPVLSGYIFDLAGNYKAAFFAASLIACLSFLLALLLKLGGRRI
ncbi:MAG: MFS transporter [Pseudomonadota bacterium]